jgi:hypothetical protein
MINQRLNDLTRLNNLSMKIHNKVILDAYPESTEAATILKETLSITANDSSIAIIQKMLTFYLGCDKLSPEFDERVLVNKAVADKASDRIIVEIRVRANKRYKNGKQTGYRDWRIPNISLKYLEDNPKYFAEMTYKHGTTSALYVLKDGHQLKIMADSLTEAHRITNYVLRAIEPALIYGDSESHSKPVIPPKDAAKSPIDGEPMKVYKVVAVDPNTGKPIGAQRIY